MTGGYIIIYDYIYIKMYILNILIVQGGPKYEVDLWFTECYREKKTDGP